MKLLLDTHILLWWIKNNKHLTTKARQLIENQRNVVIVSAASMWELAVKRAVGKIEVDLTQLEQYITAGDFETLSITMHHAVAVSDLPMHHRDPFDRMLLAQCIVESAQLLTSDAALKAYGKFVVIA